MASRAWYIGLVAKTNQTFNGKTRKKETSAKRIKSLERELTNEKDKNLILSKMIDIVEKDYGVSIRKKHVPKPSGPPGRQANDSGTELQIVWDQPAEPVSAKTSRRGQHEPSAADSDHG